MRGVFKDLTGEKFGRLICVGHERRGSVTYWICQCSCGDLTEVALHNLSRTNSCGCLRREREAAGGYNLKHGMSGTRAYMRWAMLRQREGLVPEWHWSFEEYYKHVGEPPSPKLSTLQPIERGTPMGPGNFKWGTRAGTHGRMYTLNGVTQNMAGWADSIGISRERMRQRIDIAMWPIERALTEGPYAGEVKYTSKGRPPVHSVTIGSETKSLTEWAAHFGISYPTMYARYRSQLRLEQERERMLEKIKAKAKGRAHANS